MEMTAAVLWEPHAALTVEAVQLPDPGPGDVLVRVVGSGVCGSELHVIDGEVPVFAPPIVLGHEVAGIVEEVGSDVRYVRPGDHVILGFRPGCGRCELCWNGEPSRCQSLPMDGSLYDGATRLTKDGTPLKHLVGIAGFAQYALVGERTCIKVREDAPLDKVCLLGCSVATGFSAVVHYAQFAPGATAAVIGCGGVGLNVIQSLALNAASMIIAVDINDTKLELARQLGATHTVNSRSEDPVATIMEWTKGIGVDYSFEVITRSETVMQAIAATRADGTITVVGNPSPMDAAVTIPASMRKRLQASSTGGTQWTVVPQLVDLYMSGRLKLDPLISRTRPLEEVNPAIEDLRSGAVTRTVLLPHG